MNRSRIRWIGLVAAGLLLGTLLWGGLMVANGRVSLDSLFVPCTSAIAERELMLRMMLLTYDQPCSSFYHRYYPDDEFHNLIRLNNYGMHDGSWTEDKPEGVYRILLVGDDYTQAWQVAQEQTFAQLAETLLNDGASRRYEIINLGFNGYGIDRGFMLYALMGAEFEADLVLLTISTADDLSDSEVNLEERKLGTDLGRPYFTLDADGGLRLHNSPLLNPEDLHNAAYRWLVQMTQDQEPPPNAQRPTRPRVADRDPYTLEFPLEYGLYLDDSAPWQAVWPLNEALILSFRDLVQQGGADFAALIIPPSFAIHRDDWVLLQNQYPALEAAGDPLEPSGRMETLLKDHGIPHVNMAWTLAAETLQDNTRRLYYLSDPHLTPLGHQMVAERLVNWLHVSGLLDEDR